MRKSVLNREQTRVLLFQSLITLDKDLPKYKTLEELKAVQPKDDKNEFLKQPSDSYSGLSELSYDSIKEYFEKEVTDVADFNLNLSDTMRKTMERTRIPFAGPIEIEGASSQPKSLWETIRDYFLRKNERREERKKSDKFDVLQFFANVKLSTKEEGYKYKDRLKEYVTCIGYAESSGQKALKERLFEQLVVNKYESMLYAIGQYKVLTEQNLVKFAKGCPRALCLDYIANYVRTIPVDVIKRKKELDRMEIFDNYVILHYDPEDDGTEKTNKEKEEEARKKRDPILFGVISGSNKLYYVADWEDEYCNLRFQDIVDKLGQELIEKDYLNGKIPEEKEDAGTES